MYEQFFGMQERPFTLAPDTQYFFCHQGQRQALEVLTFALSSGEGFIKITGEVGTGKTLLCRELLNRLDDNYYTAYIPNPYMSPVSLHKALADELGIATARLTDYEILKKLNNRLLGLSEQGKHVVVCIDEAQSVPDQTLEALRLLSNLETERRKLLQIVLFGQPELDEKLARPRNRQLRQRIVYSYQLQPLDRIRVAGYLDYRIRIAGYNGDMLFRKDAVEYLYKASGGIPRIINILSNKALMMAFGKGERSIGVMHVRAAIADTEGLKQKPALLHIMPYLGMFMVGTVFLLTGVYLAWKHML